MIVINTIAIYFTNKDYAMEVEDTTCIPTYLTIQLVIQKILMKLFKKGHKINNLLQIFCGARISSTLFFYFLKSTEVRIIFPFYIWRKLSSEKLNFVCDWLLSKLEFGF